MASIILRGKVWRAMIVRNGQRVSASFDTRADAEKWAIHTEASILGGAKIEGVPARKQGTSIEVLFQRYADEISPTKRGCDWERSKLKMLVKKFPVFRGPILDLDASALAEWRDQRLAAGKSPHTVNRELTLVASVFNAARKEWRLPGLMKSNPVHDVTRPAIPRPRKQRVSEEQREKIFQALEWDEISQPLNDKHWVAFAFKLAIETAMRKGEILRITWADVRLDKRFIHLPITKNGDERNVPLSSKAMAMLMALKPGNAPDRLVPVTGWRIDALLSEARTKTGLREIRFHDTRREAATVMSKKLSNVLELAAVTGHKSLQVLKRYYEPDPTDLADKLD